VDFIFFQKNKNNRFKETDGFLMYSVQEKFTFYLDR